MVTDPSSATATPVAADVVLLVEALDSQNSNTKKTHTFINGYKDFMSALYSGSG